MLTRFMSRWSVSAVIFLVAAAGTTLAQDNWLGGFGNWSNSANWSAGLPNTSSDVVIGMSSDFVTLDTNASIASLTLGNTFDPPSSAGLGAFYSVSLTVAGAATVNQSGELDDFSSGSSWSFGSLNNQGVMYLGSSATLNLGSSVTDVPLSASYYIEGNFTSGAGSGLKSLQSVEGQLLIMNGQNNVITPPSGTLYINAGPPGYALFQAEGFATITVNGNLVDSSGVFATQGNINVTGSFVNNPGANFCVCYAGEVGNVGSLSNSGKVVVGSGATLNLMSQPNGLTDVVAGSTFDLGGTFNAGTTNSFYQLTSVEGTLILENGQTTTATPIGGTFTVGSTGYVEVKTGTTFNVNGNVTVNSGGIFSVNDPFPTTVNITGMLTNLGGTVNVVGPNALLNAGGIGNGGMLTLPEGSTVNLANGFYQLAGGTLGEAIGTNGYAIIMVNGGLVMLDGTLDVLLDIGYNPTVGSTFKFFLFNPGALSGQFASIQNDIFKGGTEKWVVVYNDAGGYLELEAQATPEPGTLTLLGTGLLSAVYGARRRWSR